jgi:hypothetical protein
LALSEVLFKVLFFSFVTEEHQHQGTPTLIDPSINIVCDVLPAAAFVHVVAVAVIAAADVTLVVVALALALSLSPLPP